MKALIKEYFTGCLTVPNLLSFLRIVMVPIFVVLFRRGEYGWAAATLVLSGLSDLLDGKIARKFNQVSELGKILDPVADKLTQITIAIMFYLVFRGSSDGAVRAFSWIFLVFLIKEAVMVIGGTIMIICGIKPNAAELPGKIATAAFYTIMSAIIVFGPDVGILKDVFTLPGKLTVILTAIGAALAAGAFCCYLPGILRQFKEKAQSNKIKG